MDKKKTRKLLILLFVGVLMGALDISIVGPAIPAIIKNIDVPRDELSWIYAIYILFNLIGLPFLARLADVLGRRMVYVISLALFGIGSLIVALSQHFDVLLIGRAIQGFGSSGVFPVAAAVIGDIFPVEKRGRALGMLGAVFGFAFLLGPVIAGVMLRYFEWNALFSINIPIAVFLIIWSLQLLPSRKGEVKKKFDWPGILLLGSFAAFFGLALNNSKPDNFIHSLVTSPVIYYLLVTVLSLLILIFLERKAAHPIIDFKLFSRRQVRITVLIAVGTGIFQSSVVFVPDFITNAFGMPVSDASFMLIPVVLATAIGSPISGRFIDKLGSRVVVVTGIILSGTGLLLMSFVRHEQLPFYIAAIIIGFGLSMLSGPSLRYIILNEVEASERTLAQGLLTMFFSLGQITGSAVIGAMTATYREGLRGYSLSFQVLTVMVVFLLFFAVRLKSLGRERAEAP
ncbi:MAG: MFS transporter [Bacteroidales bacterium]